MFFLIVRPDEALAESADAVLGALANYHVRTREVDEWPGTVLLGNHALRHDFTLNVSSAAILDDAVSGLYDWQHPELPEDLGLLRSDDSSWLTTIAHEREAFFVLEESEAADLVRRVPGLVLTIRG